VDSALAVETSAGVEPDREEVREQIVELTLVKPEHSPREVATRLTCSTDALDPLS
jgi:hypothetical protein